MDAMNELQPESRLQAFDRELAAAGRGTFLLDYDGTLAPFWVDPAQVQPYPGVVAALDLLMTTGRARVVVVTGRYLKVAAPVLPTRMPLEMWGSHGRERQLPDGQYELSGIDEFALRALTIADSWSADVEAAGGRCEAKPGSLAFHWRGAGPTQVVRIRQLVTGNFRNEALEDVLELNNFDGGIELRAPGLTKGDVVRTVLAETAGPSPVAYLGDDLTDEDAFAALRGHGLSVLVKPAWRPTAADMWVRPPAGLLRLLDRWQAVLERGP